MDQKGRFSRPSLGLGERSEVMEDPAPVDAGIRRAVELMTAWNESGEGDASFAVLLASQDMAAAVAIDNLLGESITLIAGLMSLAGRLLMELERQSKTPIPEILERVGTEPAE
jgi:hypothetical protein